MASKITDHEKQLMLLRALTATTGVVHEGQMLQIRMWGSVAFHFTKWQAEVDVAGKTVIYTLNKVVNKKSKELARYTAILDGSIHWLFGDDWSLRIREGSKTIYEGQRQQKDVNRERKSRAGNREGS